MIQDVQTQIASNQTLTANGVTEDHLNLRTVGRHIGIGKPMGVLVSLRSEPDEASGNETYSFIVEVDDNDTFSSATQVGATLTIPRTAKVSDRFVVPLPPSLSMEKYLRGSFTLTGTTPSITVDVDVCALEDIQGDVYYADNRTIE